MKNLDRDLQEVYDQKMVREKILIHVAGLKSRLKKQITALALLEIEINRSETTIETLEQLAEQPLRKIFNKILGDKKLRTLRNVDEAFKKLLKTKKQQLKHRNKDLAKKIIHFETNIRADQSMRKEIREAVDAGLIATKELEKLKKALLVMGPWRSQISPSNASTLSYKQKSYINNLLAEIGKVNGILDDFIQELSDVSTHYQLNYDQFVERISEFLEEFYDGLITDWVLHQEIKMTIHLIDDTIAKVQRILILLENDAKKSSKAEKLDRISLQELLLENKI